MPNEQKCFTTLSNNRLLNTLPDPFALIVRLIVLEISQAYVPHLLAGSKLPLVATSMLSGQT